MHSLLQRQLRRRGIAYEELSSDLQDFLAAVDHAYEEFESDRLMLERSLELSSQELLVANARMRALFQALPDCYLRLDAQGVILEHKGGTLNHLEAPLASYVGAKLDRLLLDTAPAILQAAQDVRERGDLVTIEVQFGTTQHTHVLEARLLPLASNETLLVLRDISDRQRAEDALRAREQYFRSLVQNASDMIVIVDALGRAVYASPSVERIMGYSEAEWQQMNVLTLVHPDDVERGARSLASVIGDPGVHPATEIRLRHKDGSYHMIELVAHNLISDPIVQGVVYNARDVTERHEAEEALRQREERFRALAQQASDLITVVDDSQVVVYQSPSITGLLGWTPGAVTGHAFADIVHPDDRETVASLLHSMSGKGDVLTIDARLLHSDGETRDFEIKASDLRHIPSIGGIVLNTRDVTDRKALERQLRHQAFHDPLTGLANRVRFTDRLAHALLLGTRRSRPVSVIFLDIDNFKMVNDSMGHVVGDQALKAVALRIQACMRVADTAARFGGDEFALLLEDIGDEEAIAIADKIIEALHEPFALGPGELFIRASLGVASSTTGVRDNTELLRRADIAMYVAKRAGKARYEVYDQSMRGATLRRMELLSDLQRASENGEFIVYYQPTMNLATGDVVGVEALVRWKHPTRGLLLPDEFIGLAEESGTIIDLGEWVLGEACKEAARLRNLSNGRPPLAMNVNVSVKQLQHPEFVGVVKSALDRAGLPPEQLVLEVTESVMMQDMSRSTSALRELKASGVRIAIDDFGTGYSSLGYLRQFPVDILKIDRSFVDAIGRGPGYVELLRTILDLSKTLRIVAVAEGIEREDQLAVLQEMQCGLGQGFLYAKPLPPEELERFLNDRAIRSEAA